MKPQPDNNDKPKGERGGDGREPPGGWAAASVIIQRKVKFDGRRGEPKTSESQIKRNCGLVSHSASGGVGMEGRRLLTSSHLKKVEAEM